MSSYRDFLERYQQGEEQRKHGLLAIHGALESLVDSLSGHHAVLSRVKSPTSTWRKMHRYGLALNEVHDLLGLRVIADDVAGCYTALNAITEAWPHNWERFKDYIVSPKSNGYQSLHLCIKLDNSIRFELQIRTEAMDKHCERGAAAHGRYKRRGTGFHTRRSLARQRPVAA